MGREGGAGEELEGVGKRWVMLVSMGRGVWGWGVGVGGVGQG